jgi:hypothetical protein
LIADVLHRKDRLAQNAGGDGSRLAGERVAFLAENGYDYVGTVFQLVFYSLRTTSVIWLVMLQGLSRLTMHSMCSYFPVYPCERCNCPPAFTGISSQRVEVYNG